MIHPFQLILIATMLSVATSITSVSTTLTTGGDAAIHNEHGNPFHATWRPNDKQFSTRKAIRILNLEFGDRVGYIAENKRRIIIA